MLLRTHIALGLLLALLFQGYFANKILFFVIVLVACMLPDIDSSYSYLGRWKSFTWIHFFMRHRGILHSLTIAIVVSLLLSVFYPVLVFPFFLGIVSHLVGDAITLEGIMPLWPLKYDVKGKMKTGGIKEHFVFGILVFVDVALIANLLW